jgi:hypothetical protein
MMETYLFQIWGDRLFLFIGCLKGWGPGSGVLGNKWLLNMVERVCAIMCLESESVKEPVHLWCWGSLAVQKQSLTVK